MTLFSHLPKSFFWSHILLGVLAVFSLPASQGVESHLVGEEIVEQRLNFSELKKAETEQALFLQQEQQNASLQPRQAVEFCEFFAKPYRLLSLSPPPIRAGPIFLV